MNREEPPPGDPLRTLGWALYLGASWTWCIGLFLPVLLVRDHGSWAWVLFALPNVVGAGAMGFLLRSRQASRDAVHAHRPACVTFSLVTIAFHCYFLGWVTVLLAPAWTWAGYTLVAVIFILGMRNDRRALVSATIVMAISFAVLLYAARSVGPGSVLKSFQVQQGSIWSLSALFPAFVMGFGLCPYLDLTFHHARQQNDRRSARTAFGLGFGVFFLAMIFLTLLYALPLATGKPGLFRGLVGVHMLVQIGFTLLVHLRRLPSHTGRPGLGMSVPAGVVALALFLLAPLATATGLSWRGLDGRELGYWLFMAPYGLLFPAYVWIVMIPERRGAAPSRRTWWVLAGVILVALPMFWMGFVESQPAWLLPGTGLVLAAGYLVPRHG